MHYRKGRQAPRTAVNILVDAHGNANSMEANFFTNNVQLSFVLTMVNFALAYEIFVIFGLECPNGDRSVIDLQADSHASMQGGTSLVLPRYLCIDFPKHGLRSVQILCACTFLQGSLSWRKGAKAEKNIATNVLVVVTVEKPSQIRKRLRIRLATLIIMKQVIITCCFAIQGVCPFSQLRLGSVLLRT